MIYKLLVFNNLNEEHIIYTSSDPLTYWSLNGGRIFIKQMIILKSWRVEDEGVLYGKDLRATEPRSFSSSPKFVRVAGKPGKQERSPNKASKTDVVSQKNSSSPDPTPTHSSMNRLELGEIADEIARLHNIPPNLLKALIQVESNWNPRAISSKGAKGLTQLTDATAKMLGVRDVFDPVQNMEAGARYLKMQIDRFRDLKLALVAYNCGPNNVVKGKIPIISIRFANSVLKIKSILDSSDGK